MNKKGQSPCGNLSCFPRVARKKGLIGTIVLIGILLVVGFFWFVEEVGDEENAEDEIMCVPATCCHATECVQENEAPNCSGAFCTMSCEPDTLDCGQARCEYINESCGVVLNE